ncbi:MAG: CDP-alcohol phosphatidyltransferase family protein [Planctomycetes bacterium]|jgi:CDP-diacylglycerol--glycerol-3-phosphate 3-phosphatidyltransferase|nr:CDP-alcohol phosphatidyltransferase family protein [Planctomycetota bacterium]
MLKWLPRGNTFRLSWPTRITLLRILLIWPFVDCMLGMHDPRITESQQNLLRYAAIGLFLLMAISDAVDGYWARHGRQITKLGAFLDPLADKLLITSASLLLVSERGHVAGFLLPMTVVVLIIGKDVLITIGFAVMYLLTSHLHIVPVFAGKLSTALQLSMVIAVLIAPDLVGVIPGYRAFVHVLWWAAAAAAVVAALVYIRNGSRYIEEYERTHGQRLNP